MSDSHKVVPFRRGTPTAPSFPERALTAAEWRDLITAEMRMHVTEQAKEFLAENLNIDVEAIDEIIRRIGRFGVLGVPRATN